MESLKLTASLHLKIGWFRLVSMIGISEIQGVRAVSFREGNIPGMELDGR